MKHKLFSFSAILAILLSLTACAAESIADVNYSEIAASDGSLVFTTSSTPEISTEPSVEPINSVCRDTRGNFDCSGNGIYNDHHIDRNVSHCACSGTVRVLSIFVLFFCFFTNTLT